MQKLIPNSTNQIYTITMTLNYPNDRAKKPAYGKKIGIFFYGQTATLIQTCLFIEVPYFLINVSAHCPITYT